MPSALVTRWRMCLLQTFGIICKGCILNMCCLPRFTVKTPVGVGVRVSVTDYVTQNSSSALAFPSLALEMGKFPQLRSDKDRREKSQTKISRKTITKDCNQDDGRVWVRFVCFFSEVVQGQSWHIFKCHICSVIWQTCLLLLPPN